MGGSHLAGNDARNGILCSLYKIQDLIRDKKADSALAQGQYVTEQAVRKSQKATKWLKLAQSRVLAV